MALTKEERNARQREHRKRPEVRTRARERMRARRLDPILLKKEAAKSKLYREKHPEYFRKYVESRKDGIAKVYFIQAASGPIKIGFAKSKTATVRLQELQVANYEILTLLGWFPGAEQDEKSLHKQFRHARIRGEWFRPVPGLLELIQARCSTTT